MTAQEFIFDTPLYKKIYINEENNLLGDIVDTGKIFDGYNPLRHKESSYVVSYGICNYRDAYGLHFDRDLLDITNLRTLLLSCKRYDDKLTIYILWNAEEKSITKVGQYPSIADIHIGQIKQYDKVLPKEKLREFTKAIGLAANGVGVGSFVYLRRIFESLIFEIANISINAGHIDKSNFERSRMDEKIELLSDKLPRFLVENKAIYKILSAGIHELSEEECLAHFDVMRVSIELILDERVEALEKENKVQKARNALSNIAASIKK